MKGADGSSVLTGLGVPTEPLGNDGDSYIDLESWDYYLKEKGAWVKKGNIRGMNGQDGIDGKDGVDGKDGQDGKNGTNGQDGQNGKSAYELYVESHPDYKGNEEQWLDDLVNGRLGEKQSTTYTVTFVLGYDQRTFTQYVEGGKKAKKPDDPTRPKYTFKDWVDSEGEHWVFNGFPITEDISLFATWEKVIEYPAASLLDINDETVACLADPAHEHKYGDKKLTVEGTVTAYMDNVLYLQDFCYYEGKTGAPEPGVNGEYVGIKVFTGMSVIPSKYTQKGAYLSVPGQFAYSEYGPMLTDCSFPIVSSGEEEEAQVLISPEDNTGIHALHLYEGTMNDVNAALSRYKTLYQPVQTTNKYKIEAWKRVSDSCVQFDLKNSPLAIRVFDPQLNDALAKEYVDKRVSCNGISAIELESDVQVPVINVASCADIVEMPASGPLIESPTTITFWGGLSYTLSSQLQAKAEQFKQIEPNVTVQIQNMGSHDDTWNQIKRGIPSESYPDMAMGYTETIAECIEYGIVSDLSEYTDDTKYGWSSEDQADLYSTYLEGGTSYGVVGRYSLPFTPATEAMYYNKTVLIGLDLSSVDPSINGGKALSEEYINNLTWEDLFGHLIPALQAYDNAQDAEHKILTGTRYAHHIFGYDSDDNLFITLANQYGYGYTSIDEATGKPSIDFVNDGMKGLMKTLKGAYDSGGFITKSTNSGGYTSNPFVDVSCLFSVSSTNGASYVSSPNFETGVAKLPHPAGKAQASIAQGLSLAVLDHGDEDRAFASWLFYKYLTGTDNNAAFAISNACAPLRKSSVASSSFQEHLASGTITAATASYMVSVTDDLFYVPAFKGAQAARELVSGLMYNCLTDSDLDANIDALFNDARNKAIQHL